MILCHPTSSYFVWKANQLYSARLWTHNRLRVCCHVEMVSASPTSSLPTTICCSVKPYLWRVPDYCTSWVGMSKLWAKPSIDKKLLYSLVPTPAWIKDRKSATCSMPRSSLTLRNTLDCRWWGGKTSLTPSKTFINGLPKESQGGKRSIYRKQ